MSELEPGVYEAVLTELLGKKLPADPRLYRLATLDRADAPAVLARHLESVIEMVLAAPGLDGSPGRQVAFCNEVIELIAARAQLEAPLVDLVRAEAQQLLEVLRPPDTPLVEARPLARPTTPLSQNALLVASTKEPALAAELRRELASADRVDLLCAFVRWSGIRVLMEELRQVRARGVPVRVITTTYTGATEARALDELAALGADIKVCYETGSTRLHAKAWLFERNSGFSTAYIGSSNLSRAALHEGLEWNVRLSQALSAPLLDRFRATFETYWADPSFEPYVSEEFTAALNRVTGQTFETELVPFDIQPYPFQREMLYQLEVERKLHGRWRNLLVAATGTGKTVVSAFDYKRLSAEWGGASLLFVAHREEILKQSLATFRHVLRDGSFGELMVAGQRPREGRHVFASIQSLHALGHRLDAFAPDAYDMVIVDEFHHAEAPTYLRLLERVQPKTLLGMTATPERADGKDIKQWFGGHIAVELRLWDALEQGLLCPFQYFGVADEVDLSAVRWSRGAYERGQLERVYTGNDARVAKVLRALRDIVEDHSQMRALGFCVGVQHARYMAESFQRAGIPAVAVSAESTPAERSHALQSLKNLEVNALFAVDLFNEGLDIPEIDTVMFLRPTESPVVFLQQLGRGLRRTEGKAGLTVLDFIGQQHQRFRFEERYRALLGGDRRNAVRQIQEGFPYLPAGCAIKLDRQSEKTILDNIRDSVRHRRSRVSEALHELGDLSLSEFLEASGFSLEDVYSGASPGWSALRREAGLLDTMGPDEAQLSRALARMLHIDDPVRGEAYLEWLSRPTPPDLQQMSDFEVRLLEMLHFGVWSADPAPIPLTASLERLWANPNIVRELRELLAALRDRAARLTPGAGLEPEVPLRLHARYSRNELLAAFGETTAGRPSTWREGVRWIERYQADVFLVTLNKSERYFSPSTRYRDYPISPNLFHWESQSTTSESSPTGQRYIGHRARGSRVLLFVRESRVGDSLGASPFLFLGAASYLRHEGERPMAITWRLDQEMPPDFFQAAKVAA